MVSKKNEWCWIRLKRYDNDKNFSSENVVALIKYRDATQYFELKQKWKIYLTLKQQGKTIVDDEKKCCKVEK